MTMLTRTISGRQAPLPGRYTIDAGHSSVTARVKHLMLAKVRVSFEEVSGTVVVAEDITDSGVDAVIAASSFRSGDPRRDEHVRSEQLLDVARFPTLEYHGRGVRPQDEAWILDGDLTLHGITRAAPLTLEHLGSVIDHRGHHRAAFAATTSFSREDYGVTWNQALEAGGVVVGSRVEVTLEIQAVLL